MNLLFKILKQTPRRYKANNTEKINVRKSTNYLQCKINLKQFIDWSNSRGHGSFKSSGFKIIFIIL